MEEKDRTPLRKATRKPASGQAQETGATKDTTAASGTKERKPRARRTSRRPLEPLEEAIRRRAYEIYVTRRGVDGSDLEDWLQAERELRPLYEEVRS